MSEWTFTFPAEAIGDFNHLIGKANRRLERAGSEARFEPTVTVTEVTETTDTGLLVTRSMAKATMPSLRLSLGRFTFVARLVPEEAGMTVHTAPGESLEGWVRPSSDDQHCDHCGVKRNRVNLFVVRDEDTGTLIQLGQQCISLYTGMEPKGLWALNFDEEIAASSKGWNGGGSVDYGADIEQVLGLALALTEGGRGYVSRAKAEWSEQEATGATVHRCLLGLLPKGRDADSVAERDRLLSAIAEGKRLAADEALIADVRSAATDVAGDYGDNLRVILASESGRVSRRNISTLASLVSVFHRLREARAERKAKPVAASGFLGGVGERIRNFDLTVTVVRSLESDYGTTTLMVGSTDDGHVAKWFASGDRNWEPGDRLHFAAATVKAQEQYQGTDQTVLTRGHKVEVISDGEGRDTSWREGYGKA